MLASLGGPFQKSCAESESALEKGKAELEEARKQLEAMNASVTRLQDGNNDLMLSIDNLRKENEVANVKLQRAQLDIQKQTSTAEELTQVGAHVAVCMGAFVHVFRCERYICVYVLTQDSRGKDTKTCNDCKCLDDVPPFLDTCA